MIEKLERQLDAVQSKMAASKRQLLHAEQQRVASEQAARQVAWEAALKAEKASGRVEAAVEEVRELSLDCRAAEAVSQRLAQELRELRETESSELSEDLVAAVRLVVQRHKVLLAEKTEDISVPQLLQACAPQRLKMPSLQMTEVKKAQAERGSSLDVADEAVLGDAKKDLETLNVGGAGKSKALQQEIFESTKETAMSLEALLSILN